MANKKTVEDVEEFEEIEEFEESPIFLDLDAGEATETKEEMQARIVKLEAELKAKTEAKKEEITMAKGRLGGIYLVTRATTYKGRTLQVGQKIHLEEANAANRWLRKVGEFQIDKGFQEDLNGKIRNHVEEDGVTKEAYRE